MKDKLKGLMLGILVGTLITGGSVFAANKVKIEVNYENLKYKVDSVEKKPSQGQGFIYEGSVYVPLRFAGEALGKEVSWDGETKTVWIGKKEGEVKYLSDIDYATSSKEISNTLVFDKWDEANNFTITGDTFLHGIGAELRYFTFNKVSVDYNLKQQYKMLRAFIGIDDSFKDTSSSGTIKLIGDGKELFVATDIRPGDLPQEISVDVSGIKKLQVVFDSDRNDQFDPLRLVIGEARLSQ